jgi:hypothetical protein
MLPRKERLGNDPEVVRTSLNGVVAGGHRLAAHSVGSIGRTCSIRPPPSLIRPPFGGCPLMPAHHTAGFVPRGAGNAHAES